MAKRGIQKTIIGSNYLLWLMSTWVTTALWATMSSWRTTPRAGHVEVGDFANFGGYSGVPQFRKVGAFTHIAGMSLVTKDVPAYGGCR